MNDQLVSGTWTVRFQLFYGKLTLLDTFWLLHSDSHLILHGAGHSWSHLSTQK